jgi:hypothetical protein
MGSVYQRVGGNCIKKKASRISKRINRTKSKVEVSVKDPSKYLFEPRGRIGTGWKLKKEGKDPHLGGQFLSFLFLSGVIADDPHHAETMTTRRNWRGVTCNAKRGA